jgi:hypothetical protein
VNGTPLFTICTNDGQAPGVDAQIAAAADSNLPAWRLLARLMDLPTFPPPPRAGVQANGSCNHAFPAVIGNLMPIGPFLHLTNGNRGDFGPWPVIRAAGASKEQPSCRNGPTNSLFRQSLFWC